MRVTFYCISHMCILYMSSLCKRSYMLESAKHMRFFLVHIIFILQRDLKYKLLHSSFNFVYLHFERSQKKVSNTVCVVKTNHGFYLEFRNVCTKVCKNTCTVLFWILQSVSLEHLLKIQINGSFLVLLNQTLWEQRQSISISKSIPQIFLMNIKV